MSVAAGRNASVGVVGLGIMGSAIARNLLAAGFEVTGYDPDPARAALSRRYGVSVCESVADCVRPASLLLSSLPHARALELTVEAVLAVRDELSALPLVVELSTLSLEAKRRNRERLAEAGIGMLDCPISGTGAQAASADLALYASGDRAAFDSCQPILARFARAVHYVGEFGNGTRLKLIANLLVAVHNLATAEAICLARLAGLDPLQACALLNSGAAASRILELRGPMVAREIYEPATMKLDVWQKDLKLIDGLARQYGASTPLFDATRPLYAAAIDAGLGALDTAAVARILQRGESPASGEEAPWVVLLHGLGGDAHLWDATIAGLGAGYRFLNYDFPGHGRAPPAATPYTIESLAEELASRLDADGIARAHVVGFSLGGAVAMAFAARHPGRIDRLVSIDAVPHYPEPVRQMWRDRVALARSEGMAALVPAILATWFTADALERNGAAVRYARSVLLGTDPGGYAAGCEALAALDLRAALPAIRAKTLVLCGDDDLPPFRDAAILLETTLPDAQLAWLHPARHAALLERQAEFVARLREFLERDPIHTG